MAQARELLHFQGGDPERHHHEFGCGAVELIDGHGFAAEAADELGGLGDEPGLAGDCDRRVRVGVDEAVEHRLQTAVAERRDGKAVRADRAERVACQGDDVVHDHRERGIELPDGRRGERAQHSRIWRTRPAASQQAHGQSQVSGGHACASW